MNTLKLLIIGCALLSWNSSYAQEPEAAQEKAEVKTETVDTKVKAEPSQSADKFVKQVSNTVVEILKSKSSESEKQKRLTEMFQSTMDIDWIARFVVGKYWKNMNEKQQQEYLKNYRDYLTASYVPVFKDYNGQAIVIKSVKSIGADSYLVVTDIKSQNSDVPYKVEYRIKHTEAGYKVRDIIAEGVSMITTQRSEFGSIVGNEGVASLNTQLASKAKELK